MNAYCVIGDTEKDARDFLNYYVMEKGDWEAVSNITQSLGMNNRLMAPEKLNAFKFHFIAGWGGYPLVGTARQIAEELAKLSRVGFDGTLLNWPRYEEGLGRFVSEVLPLTVQMGLRHEGLAR